MLADSDSFQLLTLVFNPNYSSDAATTGKSQHLQKCKTYAGTDFAS